MNADLVAYYKQRALEYERIYSKPERQDAIRNAGRHLQNIFRDKKVLEIACGTGFWTEIIAETADSILATDINQTVIDIAKQKHYKKNNVDFRIEDIFQTSTQEKYHNLFGGFIWSHIPVQDLNKFLNVIHNTIVPGGTIVFMDNKYVEGSNTPITEKDSKGNTYQNRKLVDGTSHKVLKNFPDEKFLRDKLDGVAQDLQFIDLKYFWMLIYKLPES